MMCFCPPSPKISPPGWDFLHSRHWISDDGSAGASDGEEQPFDFLQAGLGVLFCEAREFAAERDEIAVAPGLLTATDSWPNWSRISPTAD
jgi:hypothetical protein